jgi:hypothetical protein
MKQPQPQPQPELSERAQKALSDRDRQYRHYTKAKIAELHELCATPPFGAQLADFVANLRTFGIDDSYARWIHRADKTTRTTAMSIAAHRIMEIRISAGMLPFDDPLPGSDDDVFQLLRQVFEPH